MSKVASLAACLIGLSLQPAAHASSTFYVNPESAAAQWVKQHPDSPESAKIRAAIVNVPSALWLTGTSQTTDKLTARINLYVLAAQNVQKVPILVAYNLPHRDCSGGASAGGAGSAAEYRGWIDQLVNGVSYQQAVIVLEPDALADMQCLNRDNRDERLALLNYAISSFRQRAPHADVYLDAGNAGWKPAGLMADELNAAGVKNARGFALNISSFYTLAQSRDYGAAINAKLSADHDYTKSIVVDTSRNGNGAVPGDWCNPPGRRVGIQTQSLSPNLLALWIKLPGNSDGESSPKTDCHGGPAAGTFSAALAVRLIDGN
ncbi:glycoside hydrolase family 6 protein [Pseudomonas sp. ADAK13]|uniref:glycoside hydrolase family 6 protein n=1 Tax=Pseudomonas sp. ADAK13 TaxID=2730847 RepID=UPI0014637633|nr:glycoside hydrolase family 6 protein [Pseudomonas sp. ADAK13]QJI37109.1 endoglucanase [Pseudomonas sp. ADAK13]